KQAIHKCRNLVRRLLWSYKDRGRRELFQSCLPDVSDDSNYLPWYIRELAAQLTAHCYHLSQRGLVGPPSPRKPLAYDCYRLVCVVISIREKPSCQQWYAKSAKILG